MPRTAAELVALLDLERIDDDLFRGAQMPTTRSMVFGGQVAAQALVAATRTVEPPFAAHSMHSYFLQRGDPTFPTIYDVQNIRDGRSFATRRVVAQQHGRPIYSQTVNFHRGESGFEHQESMPDVPPPDASPVRQVTRRSTDEEYVHEWDVAEIRTIGSSGDGRLEDDPAHPARQRVWLRVAPGLPDDPVQHLAAFTYMSDLTLTGAALAPHGLRLGDGVFAASLDHAIWFHRPFRADEWWLYDQISPIATAGRGQVFANVFTQDGVLVATVVQEMLLRPTTRTEGDPDADSR